MATRVARRLATTLLAGMVMVPTALLVAAPALAEESPAPEVGIDEPVYVEADPDPVTGLYPGQYVPATESSPATPGWITGGTLQEGTAARPAAKPVAKAAVKPAAAAPVRSTRTTTVRAPRTTTTRTSSGTSGSVGEATVLPFTGPGRLAVQVTVGGGLVLLGGFVMVAARPRACC